MPKRQLVAKELAEVLRVIAHPDRIRIIEELRAGECDVNSLVDTLELPGPRVSQHLGLMRLHHIVEERHLQPHRALVRVDRLGFGHRNQDEETDHHTG